MRTIVFFLLLMNLPFAASAQNLIIEYDVTTDEITYWDTLGHRIKHPAAQKNKNVLLRLTNFNDYTLDATITATGHNEKVANSNINLIGGKVLGLEAPSFTNFVKSGDPDITAMLQGSGRMAMTGSFDKKRDGYKDDNEVVISKSEILEIPELEEILDDKHLAERQKKFQELQRIETKLSTLTSEINQLESELNTSRRVILNHKNTLVLTEYAVPYMEGLKYNDRISAEKRKKLLTEMMTSLFQTGGEDLPLKDVLDFFTQFEGNVKADLSLFGQLKESYLGKTNSLSGLKNAILDNYLDGVVLANELMTDCDSKIKQCEKVSSGLYYFQDFADEFSHKLPQINIPLLFDKVYRNYLDIELNPFEYTFSTPAEGDMIDFDIQLFRKDDQGQKGEMIKRRKVKLPVKGGVKVNSSVGIGFGTFAKAQDDYYNRDSLIMSEGGDSFSPLITTLIHFYPQGGRQVAVGGSFGIGLPLTGDFTSPSFLFGPSFIAGKSERIVLSLGVMGAKTARLAEGYQVGDTYGSKGEPIPTKNKYELGYFFSATFNLSSL